MKRLFDSVLNFCDISNLRFFHFSYYFRIYVSSFLWNMFLVFKKSILVLCSWDTKYVVWRLQKHIVKTQVPDNALLQMNILVKAHCAQHQSFLKICAVKAIMMQNKRSVSLWVNGHFTRIWWPYFSAYLFLNRSVDNLGKMYNRCEWQCVLSVDLRCASRAALLELVGL